MDTPIFDLDHLKQTYFKMALPVVLGLVVSLVYNLADTYFVAMTGNTDIVAAVSLCGPIFTTLMAFGNIYGQGGSSLISRLLGVGDKESIERVSSFCFYAAIVTGLISGALLLIFRAPMLTILGADPDTLPHAQAYYTVMALGAPFVVLSFIHSNLLRCEGLANLSMLGSVFGTVLNIILDPILISGLKLGAFGAAVATVIGYVASDIFFLIILKRHKTTLSVNPARCRVKGQEATQIFGVGIPAAASNLTQSLATILLNQALLVYGNDYIACMGIVMRIVMISMLVMVGFSFGGVPMIGFLYGSGNKEKLREMMSFVVKFLCGLAAALTAILFLAAPYLIGVFLKEDALVALAIPMLRFQVIGSVFAAVTLLFTVYFQAIGEITASFIMSLSRQGIVFMAALIVLKAIFGYDGVLASQAAADVLSAGLGGFLYLRKNKAA